MPPHEPISSLPHGDLMSRPRPRRTRSHCYMSMCDGPWHTHSDRRLHAHPPCHTCVRSPLSSASAHAMIREAVEIERDFVCDALPVSLIGMNAKLMMQCAPAAQYLGTRPQASL